MAVGVDVGGHIALPLLPGVTVLVSHTRGLTAVSLGVAVVLRLTVRIILTAAQMIRGADGSGVGTVSIRSTA